jgi:hypothetical protein
VAVMKNRSDASGNEEYFSGLVFRRQRMPILFGHIVPLSGSKSELPWLIDVIFSLSYSRLGFPSFGLCAELTNLTEVLIVWFHHNLDGFSS